VLEETIPGNGSLQIGKGKRKVILFGSCRGGAASHYCTGQKKRAMKVHDADGKGGKGETGGGILYAREHKKREEMGPVGTRMGQKAFKMGRAHFLRRKGKGLTRWPFQTKEKRLCDRLTGNKRKKGGWKGLLA